MNIRFFKKEFISLDFLKACQKLFSLNDKDKTSSDKKSQFIYTNILLNHLFLESSICGVNALKLGAPDNLIKAPNLSTIVFSFTFNELISIFYPLTEDSPDFDKLNFLKWRKRLYRLFDFLTDSNLISNVTHSYNQISFSVNLDLISIYSQIKQFNEFESTSEEYQELLNFSSGSEKLLSFLVIQTSHEQILKLLSDKLTESLKNSLNVRKDNLNEIKLSATQKAQKFFCIDLELICSNLKNTLIDCFGITSKNVCAYLKRGLSKLLNLDLRIKYSDLLFLSFMKSNRFMQYLNKTANLIFNNLNKKIIPKKKIEEQPQNRKLASPENMEEIKTQFQSLFGVSSFVS